VALISDLHSIFVNHFFPDGSIPLPSASWITLSAVGDEVSWEDSAALPDEILPVQLFCQSFS